MKRLYKPGLKLIQVVPIVVFFGLAIYMAYLIYGVVVPWLCSILPFGGEWGAKILVVIAVSIFGGIEIPLFVFYFGVIIASLFS